MQLFTFLIISQKLKQNQSVRTSKLLILLVKTYFKRFVIASVLSFLRLQFYQHQAECVSCYTESAGSIPGTAKKITRKNDGTTSWKAIANHREYSA